jgi:amino acid transporter
MARLLSRLSLPEAIGLSLAVISPTVTAAFNITLVVQATGPAAPLTFAIGTVAMALIALSFMAFTHRVAHAGSAYAYIAHTFGRRMGFVAGWTMLLTYLGFATGFAALVGSFSSAALKQAFGVDGPALWLGIGGGGMLVAWWLAYRDMRLAGRLMLWLEGAAVVGILGLCISILHQAHPGMAQTVETFRPSSSFGGWPGLGFGLVFGVLCFAGFEGAATLGEETVHPRRNIPIALFATVIGSGVFFVFIAYCEVIGFGSSGIKALADSQAPLNDLALRYASPGVAIALDLAAAVSCFSGILGCMAASGRILFALGRVGLSPTLAGVHAVHGTPASAVSAAAILIILPFALWAPFVGAANFYSYSSTIAALALILVYIAVGVGEVVEASREGRSLWPIACTLGPLLLLWVLYCNLYPVPGFPNNLWPYVALGWMLFAWVIMRMRPKVCTAPAPAGFVATHVTTAVVETPAES